MSFPSKADAPAVPGLQLLEDLLLVSGPCGWVLKNPYGKMLIPCILGKQQVDCVPTVF